ncbi:hypothetical protein [Streptomyces sp. NPDC091294]|uniref:hypothetical protein n=1 Tax=Streptomyces sp. NPDC091294 TaxID=3365992 RepID=UPI0037FB8AF9
MSGAESSDYEQKFEAELHELQEMGFTNHTQNVRALIETNGNVQAAVQYILGGGGL